jgi:4-hydroxy-tetrahydrodipicolinate reductase
METADLSELALLGYGKMGILIEEVAQERGLEIVERFTSSKQLSAESALRERLGAAVLVDFSVSGAVLPSARAAAELGLNLVIGTTGWHGDLDEVRHAVEEAGIGCVHAPNFSLGVNLFYRLIDHAARTFQAFDGYFPYLQESHHRFKKDLPSGTAVHLRGILRDAYGEREVPETCLRAGHIPGTHLVGFDSAADTIWLEHHARSRRGFAEGAVLAAEWIAGRRGFFAFRDLLDDVFPAAKPTSNGDSG